MLVTSVQWSEWTVKWREWATYICISSLSWASPATSHPLEHHRAPGYTIQQVPISWFTHGSIFIFIGISGWHICGLVTKSCLTLLWPPWTVRLGCSVHEISQTRLLVWVAISFSRESSWLRGWTHISCIAGRFFTIDQLGLPWHTYSTNILILIKIPNILINIWLIH